MPLNLISPNVIMVIATALIAILLFQPRLLNTPKWRAIVTPLASIIGSGFLVAGPILAHVAGNFAWIAMAALCALAWLFGAAIRQNIRLVEPVMEAEDPPAIILTLERASSFALAFAYFISVTYYLNLFASFALKSADIVDPLLIKSLSSAAIITLGAIGTWRGLRALENVEIVAVSIKLAMISGLLCALLAAALLAVSNGNFALQPITHTTGTKEIGILLGLVILVQGFETSRYLGDTYDAKTRVASMRMAQIIATLIYITFIILITPYFENDLPAVGGETQIVDMLAAVGTLVAPLIIVTAIASQISAAVADMNGAGGLLEAASNHQLSVSIGYLATAGVALIITWVADIFEIIVYASKAFVFYYGLQCITASVITFQQKSGLARLHVATFAVGAIFALLVLMFGLPVEGKG